MVKGRNNRKGRCIMEAGGLGAWDLGHRSENAIGLMWGLPGACHRLRTCTPTVLACRAVRVLINIDHET